MKFLQLQPPSISFIHWEKKVRVIALHFNSTVSMTKIIVNKMCIDK